MRIPTKEEYEAAKAAYFRAKDEDDEFRDRVYNRGRQKADRSTYWDRRRANEEQKRKFAEIKEKWREVKGAYENS